MNVDSTTVGNFEAKSQVGTNGQLQHISLPEKPTGMPVFINFMQNFFQKYPQLPPVPPTDTLTSDHIDKLTHKIWEFCLNFNDGQLLKVANHYGSMMAELKLRALAKLNFLPSWWFLREQLLVWLNLTGRQINDAQADEHWKFAVGESAKFVDRANRARQGGQTIGSGKAQDSVTAAERN